MSKLIEKLNHLSRTSPQPIGFGARQQEAAKPQIQVIASLALESAESLAGRLDGADAVMLHISPSGPSGQDLQKAANTMPGIPWGGWLQGGSPELVKEMTELGADFGAFPATGMSLAMLEDTEVGRILEFQASLSEGLVRTINELPVDASLVASEEESGLLTWQHLLLYHRFAALLNKPLLVPAPPNLTAGELKALWQAGVDGLVIEITGEHPEGGLKGLCQTIKQVSFTARRRGKIEPLLPGMRTESTAASTEEEEEEDE
jgi:hypothetical protein